MSIEPEDNHPLNEAFAAYLRSVDECTVGSRDEFLARFPELAGELKTLMEAADAIDRFTVSKSELSRGDVLAAGEADLADAETIDLARGDLARGDLAGRDPDRRDPDRRDPDGSDQDAAATLPEANRSAGDPGPRLPFNLGDYELLEVVGRGGMGVVYRAKQHLLNRTVAVKMIRGGMLADDNDVRRFYTEARAAAGLHHPGIVPVYQFGRRAGHHFFSMALIEGTDLQRKINRAQIPIDEAARYVRDVARALEHAHQNNVLHRDIKPANILIDTKDRIHITDFGLAKNLGADSSVTGSGAAVGTPNYMAPEQAGGHSDRATKQTDVYSLGAILFAAVTGRPPLVGDSVVDTLMRVIHEPAPPMRSLRSQVPADLETIAAKCLEKQPKKRYRSAADLADDLDAFLEGRPIAARPRGRLLKLWHWFSGVPLVGVLIGRKVVRTTPGHRRFQAAMLLCFALSPFVFVAAAMWWNRQRQAMPDRVRIAGGLENGVYNGVSQAIADRLIVIEDVPTEVIPSNGSLDNKQRLINRDVHLAPLQASAISGDPLCVVAPLFYEAAHLLIRQSPQTPRSTPIDAGTLAGQAIAVGPLGSGSRMTAEMILDSLNLTPGQCPRRVIPWSRLNTAGAPDVAIICVGRGSALVAQLTATGWRLLSIPDSIAISMQHPTLRPITIASTHYPSAGLPAEGISTLGTTAFLAARRDAPEELVRATLESLYQPPTIFADLIPRERAAEWQGLDFHRISRQFYAAP